MKVTFYGHSCFLVEGNNKRILIDPFLKGNSQTSASPEDFNVDAIILSHGHEDHFGDCLQIASENQCPIIATYELAMYCQSQGAKVHPMHIGGAFQFEGFKVKLTQAFHGSSVNHGDHTIYTGMPAGILLTMNDHTFYHAGDTGLFGDMKIIGELNEIDVAALPIGDNFTMGPEDALIAAKWLQTNRVIPIHYNTFPIIEQDVDSFAQNLDEQGIKCHILNSGDNIEI
ncbi:metal-dependent hydrolase [Chengkuizengella sp. SCS-71B]|uniref:metal-dependent hydrolase n=1 Tax=Chengkuizengella sp. SCS-71B TaxID=3115290 RepID=UPI0032C21F07